MSKNGMDNAKKKLYTNSRKKNFMIDKKRTYHVTQQQFMFVKAKTINELSKTNKKNRT